MNRSDGGLSIVMTHSNINSGGRIPMSNIGLTEAEVNEIKQETDLARQKRTGLSSLEISDQESAAVQKSKHRVTLESMKDKVTGTEYIYPRSMPHMTICIVMLENGFALVGKATPADPENFDEKLGEKFAFEDALRQMWPLEAYLLRERLML